ncbi:MAG: TRAP transporter small permease subunit [Pararhodobacter sp.]|nr:TRAP transporter small permease subunit [Pararhodobacter sp.]
MAPIETDVELDLEKVEEAGARTHALDFPRTRISDVIERGLGAVSWVINWLWIILVLIIVVNVTMRYALRINYVWVEEVQWHIYAVGFMLGIGYAILHDAHVRVDVLAANFRQRTRAWIELLSILLIIFPMVYLIIAYAIPFVEASWNRGERSSAPGGLANRWAIKAVIIVAFAYIGLAALARLLRVTAFLFGLPRPRRA